MFTKKTNYKKNSGAYISKIDKCLADFDQRKEWSDVQLAEFTKHKRIFNLRDTPSSPSI